MIRFSKEPLISVVIPTFKRPDLLARCLKALESQDLDRRQFEILIADDAADPAMAKWVEKAARRGSRIRYVAVTGKAHGPAAARNAGWPMAKASIIAFTDDDCIPDRSWLSSGLSAFEKGIDAVWGRIEMPTPQSPKDYELSASRLSNAGFVTANCFCRRQVLEQIGGFDERYTRAWREDTDFYFSILERSGKIKFEPRALIVHPIRPAPWGICLKLQKNNYFDPLLYKKFPRQFRKIIEPIPWFYHTCILSAFAGLLFLTAGLYGLALMSLLVWAVMTGRFAWMRLRGTSHRPLHILEMIVTTPLLPFLTFFWRVVGASAFRANPLKVLR